MKFCDFYAVYMFKSTKKREEHMAVGMNPKKFNIQLNNSGGGAAGVKNTVAQSLKTATRSNEINPATVNTRTSSLNAPCLYGVGAARTKTGSGVHHNAKAFYSNDNFFALQQSNQGVHFAMNSGMSNLCGHVHGANNNKMSTLEKIAMLTAVTGTVTAGILGALNAGKSTQTSGTNNSQKMAESDQAFNYDSAKFKLTGELQKAGTFGEMKGIEAKADKKLESFSNDYGSIGQKARDNIAKTEVDINNKLEGTDVKLNLDISKLSITAPDIDANDLSTLDNAAKDIGKDIESVKEFKTKDLAEANKTIDTALTSIGQEISKLEGSLSKTKAAEAEAARNGTPMPSPSSAEIQKDLDEAKAKQTKLKDAQKELNGNMAKQADDLIESLQNKQNELGDIKQVKSEIADKKYNAAQSEDKTIENNKTKMGKLQSELIELKEKASKGDTKAADKLNKKCGEYNALAKQMTKLYASLGQAETGETIKNSKGQEYKIVNTSVDANYTFEINPEQIKTKDQMTQETMDKMKQMAANFIPNEK